MGDRVASRRCVLYGTPGLFVLLGLFRVTEPFSRERGTEQSNGSERGGSAPAHRLRNLLPDDQQTWIDQARLRRRAPADFQLTLGAPDVAAPDRGTGYRRNHGQENEEAAKHQCGHDAVVPAREPNECSDEEKDEGESRT